MAVSPRDPLQELLRNEAERVAGGVLQDPPQISHTQMETLGRLARLVEIRETLRSSPSTPTWGRWTAPVLLVATLGVATLLLFTHVRRTEIELDARLSEVALRPRANSVLVEGADLVRLGVTGAHEISVRQSADWPGFDRATSDGDTLSLEIASAGNGQASGITLSPLQSGASARAWIQAGETPRQVTLWLEGDDLEIQASLLGPLRLAGAGLPSQTVDFGLPRPAFFRARKTTVILDLTARDPASIRFSSQIGVEALSLYEVKHFNDRTRRLSSVLSGSVYLGALNGSEERLRARQELRLDEVQGEIRTIQLASSSLNLQFHAYVGKLETGSYENPRNLMPAWLEWLRARHGVSLLWGTAFYIFGIVSAALRWFSRPHTPV